MPRSKPSHQTMKTLAELNADPFEGNRHGFAFRYQYAVGLRGRGEKVHLVRTEVVTGILEERGEKWGPVGRTVSTDTPCNHNGQYTARVVPEWDTDAVTCATCLKLWS